MASRENNWHGAGVGWEDVIGGRLHSGCRAGVATAIVPTEPGSIDNTRRMARAAMVRFTERDGYILWCIPDRGCDPAYLIRAYVFVNRDAAPSYTETADRLRRSVQAGVIPPPVGGHFQLSPGLQGRIRRWGEGSAMAEEGMIAFSEWLSSREWPVLVPAGYLLDREQYEAAASGHPRHA